MTKTNLHLYKFITKYIANKITRISRIVKKVFLQNVNLFREHKSFCIPKNFLNYRDRISLSFL